MKVTGRANDGCEEFLHLSIEDEGFWWLVVMVLLPQCCPGLWLRFFMCVHGTSVLLPFLFAPNKLEIFQFCELMI